MKALHQFRKEESELFNPETGEYYTGTRISPRQCELMRDAINELQDKLSLSISKTAQLVEDKIKLKEEKEELLGYLQDLVIALEVANGYLIQNGIGTIGTDISLPRAKEAISNATTKQTIS